MYTYDDQLLDSVKVRRTRLAQALLHRELRLRRSWTDGISNTVGSIILAVVICAGCVAVSFVSHLISTDPMLSKSTSISNPLTKPANSTPIPTIVPNYNEGATNHGTGSSNTGTQTTTTQSGQSTQTGTTGQQGQQDQSTTSQGVTP